MPLKFLKLKRRRCQRSAGLFIAFKGNESGDSAVKKLSWRKSDSMDIVQQMMEAGDATDSTAPMSSSMLTNRDEDESVATFDEGSWTQALPGNEKAKAAAAERRPSWLKRPMFADICGNHAMVNAERQWGNPNLRPLKRSKELDDLARAHAEEMASASIAYHADANELCSKLMQKPMIRLGENVAQGKNLRGLHDDMKKVSTHYANMLDCRYQEFGIGTARDVNGDLFLCQIFRG